MCKVLAVLVVTERMFDLCLKAKFRPAIILCKWMLLVLSIGIIIEIASERIDVLKDFYWIRLGVVGILLDNNCCCTVFETHGLSYFILIPMMKRAACLCEKAKQMMSARPANRKSLSSRFIGRTKINDDDA